MATEPPKRNKIHSTIWYSRPAYKLLELLEADTGLTKTSVIELAIRELAKTRSITLPTTEEDTNHV